MPTEPITSGLMWRAALVTMLIDAPLVLLIARGIPRARFVKLRWQLAGAAFIIFAVIWYTVGSLAYWDAVYHAIFPAWWRWLLPLIYGSLNAALALAFWRASLMAERWQAAWFILFVVYAITAVVIGHTNRKYFEKHSMYGEINLSPNLVLLVWWRF